MSLGDDVARAGVAVPNPALADEIEALNSIFGADTIIVHPPSHSTDVTEHETTAILRLPDSDVSFLVSFPFAYPDVPPDVLGTESTGENSRRGEGEAAVNILRDVLGTVFSPGAVCLFDLVEEASPLLSTKEDYNQGQDEGDNAVAGEFAGQGYFEERSATLPAHDHHDAPSLNTHTNQVSDDVHITASVHASDPSPSVPPPTWTLSEALTVNKSTFIARACPVHSLENTQSALSHLLSTNKKVASATHNISAWRIKIPPRTLSAHTTTSVSSNSASASEIVIQDCDDDGETAAGGRLLHLMQLMDVWNVLVVVTRWYGGVKLGADRFRCINSVGRDALVRGGWGKDKDGKDGDKAKGKKGKK